MIHSRIKDAALASRIDESEFAWHRSITPITQHYVRQVAARDLRGKRLACWGHVRYESAVDMLVPLAQAGAEVVMGACNVDSTDDAAAAWAAAHGVTLLGWQGMSQADYQENLALVRSFEADYLCDMGGELIETYLDKHPRVIGALEATTSGLNRLRQYEIPFPVFNWNSIPLKERLENRFHVGDHIWPAFSMVTGVSLFGKRVLVVGYGPVGKGIAERARALGAIPYVAELDPVRLLEARHHGCEAVDLDEGLARCQIVVTATGHEGVIAKDRLCRLRKGAVLCNAGHSNREIDIDWLYGQPHQRMKAHIERFDVEGTYFFLLAQGSLLNLAVETGLYGVDLWDHYTAVMLRGILWMFDGPPDSIGPGLQLYPAELEREIAEMSVRFQSEA